MLNSTEIKSTMIKAFEQWGLPQRIKIDNGYPFKPIRCKELPSLSMLWWVGLGIDATLNRLASPQENGTVEGLQRITYRWVNPKQYQEIEKFQKALNEVCRQQRETYRIRALGDKTRIELYPELNQNPRKYSSDLFDIKRVKTYMTKFVFIRKLNQNRTISLAGHKISVGSLPQCPSLSISYNSEKEVWEIRTPEGNIIKESPRPQITEHKILNFIPLSKEV